MKISKTQSFIVLGKNDFIQAAGIDTYKGIIILFDEDFDQRIFIFLKQHYAGIVGCVKAVYENEGNIILYCHKKPNEYTKNLVKNGVDITIDYWTVMLEEIYE